jgi:hypothetical protein
MIHRIEAMYGRDKTRAGYLWHIPPSQPGHPGWQSRTGMKDIHLLLKKETPQPGY